MTTTEDTAPSAAAAPAPGASGSADQTAPRTKEMKALVAIDDSEGSLYALQWVLNNLFQTSNAQSLSESGTLLLLHVQEPFHHYIYPAGPVPYATSEMIDTAKKSLEENSARIIARALELIYRGRRTSLQVKVEPLVVTGDPKEMICEVAEKIHPDVVVVGSRGLGKIKRAFLGSASDYCAHHAPCPVLIVKPPK